MAQVTTKTAYRNKTGEYAALQFNGVKSIVVWVDSLEQATLSFTCPDELRPMLESGEVEPVRVSEVRTVTVVQVPDVVGCVCPDPEVS